MRWLFPSLFLLCLSAPSLAAQPATTNSVRQCLLVPQAAVKILQRLEAGACPAGCSGCGCKGGPGYRDKSGQCVGYADINSKCGPPPHAGCSAECLPTVGTCRVHGRAFLADLAKDEGLILKWREADAETLSRYPDRASGAVESGASLGGLTATPLQKSDGSGFSCATRKTCTQMTSCDEAKYHYATCGNTRLDGSGNGVPCKALCAR